jgi:DNA-binding NtrC family response regulator
LDQFHQRRVDGVENPGLWQHVFQLLVEQGLFLLAEATRAMLNESMQLDWTIALSAVNRHQSVHATGDGVGSRTLRRHARRSTLHVALVACNFHREQTARMLGVSVRTLHYKMSRFGLH